ncbi:MAG: lipid droplet-associated protein [Mycobacterium sp.]
MATAPFGVRLLVGAATVAVEETLKLPQTILMYPITLASQAANAVMRWQQGLAELVNKGDSTLESWFPPKDENPEWATFDEDLGDGDATGKFASGAEPDGLVRDQRPDGRFALYSFSEGGNGRVNPPAETKLTSIAGGPAIPAPELVTELDYATLTLAQLRARLHTLTVEDLQILLAYEEASTSRAPFQTLLANRITRATAK